jgi:vancomycin permeability regulator SanA
MAAFALIVAAALFVMAVNLLIVHDASPYIVRDPGAAPSAPVAILLGAGIQSDGTPSPMLADRLDTALLLYREGKATSLLLSGDGRSGDNEVAAMRSYLTARGVPETDLLIDPKGFTTNDSMVRAKDIFHITSALIPTQRFHLSRAVYLARSQGISATGVPADIQHYSTIEPTVREWAARVKAFFIVHL